MERSWCESCGEEFRSLPTRCPHCRKIVCDTCSLVYRDPETEVDKKLCKDCNLKKIKEMEIEDEKQRRTTFIFYGKIIVALIVLIIIKLVVEWT